MRRVLLSPRWLVGHAVVLLLAVLCLRLGWWQWDRAHRSGGGMQNYGYALQWPLFAAFGVVAWIRICRDTLRPPAQPRPVAAPEPPAEPEPAPAADAAEPTDELGAYNRYLAELNARAGRRR